MEASSQHPEAEPAPAAATLPEGPREAGEQGAHPLRGPLVACGLAAVALVFLKAAPLTFVDPDLFHQLSLAREIVARGAVPDHDVFAYTPTLRPLVHHEWGAGLLWFGVTSVLGGAGLMLGKSLLLGALTLLTVRAARLRGADSVAVLVCAVPAILAAHYGFTTVRANLLSMVALAGLLGVLGLDPRRTRPLFAWLAVVLLWLNLHAGFVVGLGLMGIEAVERALRKEPFVVLALVTALGAALSLVNPWGLEYVRFLARGLTMARADITEWRPLYANPQARAVDLAVWASMAGLAAYAVSVRGIRACRGLGAVVATLVVSMQHQRHLTLLGVTWLAVVAPWLRDPPLVASIRAYAARRARLITWVAGAAALVWTLVALLQAPFASRMPTNPLAWAEGAPTYPAGAADYLASAGFHGRVMTPMTEGSYLMWRLHPLGVRVSFDGRFEAAYPPEVAVRHGTFFGAAPGWERVLEAYPTDAVIAPRHLPIVALLPSIPGYRPAYVDDAYLLVARESLGLPFVDRRGAPIAATFP